MDAPKEPTLEEWRIEYISIPHAAKLIGVSRQYMWRMVKETYLDAVYLMGAWLVAKHEVIDFKNSRKNIRSNREVPPDKTNND